MSAAFVSEAGVGVYDRIAGWLGGRTGTDCEVVGGLGYATINAMLADGALDGGFICGLPYVLLRDQPKPLVELLAVPVMKDPRYLDRPVYFSDLVVRPDSPARSLADLRGLVYVYNDELSNSGFNMPRHRFLEAGIEPRAFFARVLRSGSHEESLRMVADGRADASYVDSLVLDHDRAKELGLAKRVRVVESLGPSGTCPVVIATRVPAEVRSRLFEALTSMHLDPAGRAILDEALLDRFTAGDDRAYDGIRAWRAAGEAAPAASLR